MTGQRDKGTKCCLGKNDPNHRTFYVVKSKSLQPRRVGHYQKLQQAKETFNREKELATPILAYRISLSFIFS